MPQNAGGIGELAPFETWPELWVAQEDEDKAKKVIEQISHTNTEVEKICPHCGEGNQLSFQICWNCGGQLS